MVGHLIDVLWAHTCIVLIASQGRRVSAQAHRDIHVWGKTSAVLRDTLRGTTALNACVWLGGARAYAVARYAHVVAKRRAAHVVADVHGPIFVLHVVLFRVVVDKVVVLWW